MTPQDNYDYLNDREKILEKILEKDFVLSPEKSTNIDQNIQYEKQILMATTL